MGANYTNYTTMKSALFFAAAGSFLCYASTLVSPAWFLATWGIVFLILSVYFAWEHYRFETLTFDGDRARIVHIEALLRSRHKTVRVVSVETLAVGSHRVTFKVR